MRVADAIAAIASSWDSVTSLDGSRVLRLSLLRTLGERVHALRSEALALNDKSLLHDIGSVESQLNALRPLPLPISSDDLRQFLLGTPRPIPQSTQTIPNEILSESLHIALGGRDKLMRNDRTWERSIASAACQAGWTFWSLEAKLPLETVEAWHEDLKRSLWPEGLILFVESSGQIISDKGTWPGRWIIVMRTGFPPRLASNDVKWNLLFTPGGT